MVHGIYLERDLYHGIARSGHVLLSLLLKLSTLLLEVVVLKFHGLNNNLVTLVLKSQRYLYFVTTLMPLFSQKNPVHHSRTKHIQIWHHFIGEQVSNGVCDKPIL